MYNLHLIVFNKVETVRYRNHWSQLVRDFICDWSVYENERKQNIKTLKIRAIGYPYPYQTLFSIKFINLYLYYYIESIVYPA